MRKRNSATLGLVAAVLAYVSLRGRLRRYEISEESMAPTLRSGDYVLAAPAKGLARGDIVIFAHPTRRDFELVKRVVALPGEAVVIRSGQIHIDGNVLAERWADGPTRPDGEWQLGTDQIFVLGDSRAASLADSRSLGPIPARSAGWRVLARYWPPHAAARISRIA